MVIAVIAVVLIIVLITVWNGIPDPKSKDDKNPNFHADSFDKERGKITIFITKAIITLFPRVFKKESIPTIKRSK